WEGKLHQLRSLKEAYNVVQLEEPSGESQGSSKMERRNKRCTRWQIVSHGSTKLD
ncbi:hypothetical protein NDU88_001634, partial [Pleurodeles waltl]